MRKCPECGSDNLITERGLDGESRCVSCGYRDKTSEFDRHNEEPTTKELQSLLQKQQELLASATEFSFGQDKHGREIRVVLRHKEKGLWAACVGANCVDKEGNLEWEMMPSNRDEAFFERTRCSLDEAVKRARQSLSKVKEIEDEISSKH